jgi:HrpA-like RNA helicase
VVDAGRSKQKLLEAAGGGLERYVVDWVSKAAAEQRAGRAGRTGPGHAYRLYSSALYQDAFEQHTAPEIENTRLEGVMLVLKAMGVDKVRAVGGGVLNRLCIQHAGMDFEFQTVSQSRVSWNVCDTFDQEALCTSTPKVRQLIAFL